MTRYKVGVNREQADLFPARLEDYVDGHNPVRAIDAYIESLDMNALGFTPRREKAEEGAQRKGSAAGQPGYAPQALLKLYLYGYLNRVRSSRNLEKECKRNVEVMWLLEGLQPSYKTIADFRKDQGTALRRTHREFILLCKELELLGGERIAVDGSFLRGSVSKKSFVTTGRLEREIERLERELAQWLAELDTADRAEQAAGKDTDPALAQKLARIRELTARRDAKQAQQDELKAQDKTQHSDIDPDARLLSKHGQCTAGYNVQIATDARHKLIVADAVVNEPNDLRQLAPLTQEAQVVLGSRTLEAVADAGYYSAAQIAQCVQAGITPYVPVPEPRTRGSQDGRLPREAFAYDARHDVYLCPAGQILRRSGTWREQSGSRLQCYVSSETACGVCARRAHCLSPKTRCRQVWRNEHEELLHHHRERMRAHPDVMRERAQLVEHPFGTLKRRAGWDHFLVRGLDKVRGEWSLMAWAYNFTRVLNIAGIEKFKRVCAQRRQQQRKSACATVVVFWHFLRYMRREFTTRTFVPHQCTTVAFPRNLLVVMRAV